MTSRELAQRLYDIAHRKSNRSQRVRDMELLIEREAPEFTIDNFLKAFAGATHKAYCPPALEAKRENVHVLKTKSLRSVVAFR